MGTDNTISSECSCLTFVSACSGDEINLYGSTVTISCSITGDPIPYSVEIPIGPDGKVCTELQGQCHDLSICVNADNWKVCSVEGCEVQLYQEVPLWPEINGQQVGYGDLINTGTNGPFGNVVTGPLNNVFTVSKIAVCDGDPVILDLPGMDLNPNSGLCLTVNLFLLWGNSSFLVNSETYDASQVNGSYVDITSIFSGGVIGGFFSNYIIEFVISCCDGTPVCTPGAQKWAYIEVEELDFSYSATVNAGYYPDVINFVPVTSPNGTLLPLARFLAPSWYFNQLTFTGYNVLPVGKAIDWEYWEVDCLTQDNGLLLYQGSIITNDPFSIGSLLMVNNDNNCHCYRLDLSYEDDCGNSNVTDNYYFKQGENCPKIKSDNGSSFRQNDSYGTQLEVEVEVMINPIQDNIVTIKVKNIDESLMHDIIIYNSNGEMVLKKQILILENRIEIPFYEKNGVYHFSLINGNEIHSGTFIKL